MNARELAGVICPGSCGSGDDTLISTQLEVTIGHPPDSTPSWRSTLHFNWTVS